MLMVIEDTMIFVATISLFHENISTEANDCETIKVLITHLTKCIEMSIQIIFDYPISVAKI